MFGCLVASRLPQTNLQQVSETQFLFQLEHAAQINHICVFMLGTTPFPEGYAATVHFFWPGKGFQLLGMISNDKPSAIFRLRGHFTSSSDSSFSQHTSNDDLTALLGISVEPIDSVRSQISAMPPSKDPTTSAVTTAEKIAQHLFTYLSSFFPDPSRLSPDAVVPMAAIKKWYDVFLGKVRASGGTAFLDQ
ncbi:DUF775-domain-containing protein [Sistotremastrum suecicum HHB10207 ss-3]|uniref:DUF775-domain-containing protein n=1 Tax=Sistotremastrum suecicum HHB10207 ss-3 TaxID=1314776 RepID=A0A166BE64_9AGAM|nr:DUF775-domain-containing protein [Sistotremastrum suecicum HHB10207 ss-3]